MFFFGEGFIFHMSMIAIQQTVKTTPGCHCLAARLLQLQHLGPQLDRMAAGDVFFSQQNTEILWDLMVIYGDLTNRNVDFMVILMGIYGL